MFKNALSGLITLSIAAAAISASVAQAENKKAEIECLALNVYHEARSENVDGQISVAYVTMNRMKHDYFPSTICNVVWQSKQFSWTHDGKSDKPFETESWIDALDVADLVYSKSVEDLTDGSLFYHTSNVRPIWRHRLDRFKEIGSHIFYKWDGNWNND